MSDNHSWVESQGIFLARQSACPASRLRSLNVSVTCAAMCWRCGVQHLNLPALACAGATWGAIRLRHHEVYAEPLTAPLQWQTDEIHALQPGCCPTPVLAPCRRAQARNISFAADAPQMQHGVRLRHAPSSVPGSAQPQHPLALGPGFAHSAAAGEAGESGGAAALGVQPSDVLDVGPSWSNLQHVPSMATGGPAHPMALGAQHAGQGGGLAAAEGRRQQQQHAHQQQHRDGHSSLQCTLQRQTSCAAELPHRQLSRTVTLADTMLATSHSNYMRDDVPASDVVLGESLGRN